MNKMTWLAAALVLAASGNALAALPQKSICGELKNGYGPLDYRDPNGQLDRERVTNYHFTPDVEQGIMGATGQIGGDLDYTLRAIPNHIGALASMTRLALTRKTLVIVGMKYPVECYFDRAIRFAPDDGAVRAAYASFFFQHGKLDEALGMFRAALDLSPEDAAINYNLGLLYLKKKDYDNANLYAKKAYALEFPLPGLKNMLVAAGKWTDAP